MKDYYRDFEFNIEDTFELRNKLKLYFKAYNFSQTKDENENLLFFKKWSLLNGWKFNPLNWETMICIKLPKNNKAMISHTVVNNGFISPRAFSYLFKSFLINLEQFLNKNIDFKERNIEQVKRARKKVFKYYGWSIIGVLLGLFSGIILAKLTEIKLFGTIGIIVGAILAEKIINQYIIKKTFLEQGV